MANRDLVVRVRAEIGAFQRDMAAAAQAAKQAADATEAAGRKSSKAGKEYDTAGKQAESGIGRMAQTAQKHQQAWDSVSTTLMVGGAAVAGGLALSTKAAISWESAFAGVKKTVDDSPAGYRQLSDELRGLARTLPATHTEIAGVAEAAGQLGVARKDITGFTKTMIDLGESTNLTAEEAATNIAQISNVMGTMSREGSKGVQRFGSALVALGNDGASTEAEILSMSQRIAGAGATIGASEADVLALSNTLASMGVKAELGGGVTTRVLLKMRTAVDEGGESLQSFAKVAGVSADEFANKFRTAPMEALDLVSKGINRVNEAGGNVTATLKDMGIKGTEETQVMLALANSGELLADSLKLGAQAWDENLALVAEAEQRYNTTESKIRIAWNNIKDAGISAGAALLPAVSGVSDVVAKLAGAFSDLPGPVQTAFTALAGIGGVSALAVGGGMKVIGMLGDLVPKMQALGIDTPRSTRALGLFAKTLGGITAVGAGIVVGKLAIEGINQAVRSGRPDVEAYFNLLATGGDVVGAMDLDLGGNNFTFPNSYIKTVKDYYGAHTEGAAAAKQAIVAGDQNGFITWMSQNLGMGDVRRAAEDWLQLAEAGKSIARAFDMGENDLGVEALKTMQKDLELTDQEVGKLINNVPELKSALTTLATEQGIQIDPNNELGLVDLALGRIKLSAPEAGDAVKGTADGFEMAAEAAQNAKEKVDDFYESLVNAGLVVLGERDALRGLEESFAAAAAAADKNGKTLDTTTAKGRENEAALDGIAQATFRAMEAQRSAGASTAELGATIADGREGFIAAAQSMGLSEKAAAKLADSLNLIPGAVYIQFDSNTDDLAGKLTEIHELVQSTPDGSVTIEENSPLVIDALRDLGYIVTTLPDGTIKVSETGTDSTGKKIDETAGKKRTSKIDTKAITGAADKALNGTARQRQSTILATASTATAEGQLNTAARDRYSVIRTRVVTSHESYESTGRGGSGGVTRASGGSVFGPGSETSDSIPAMLSNNEHVWSAREVRGAGGHGQIERMRAMARAGTLPAFKTGGRVGWSQEQDRIFARQSANVTEDRKRAERRVKNEQKQYNAISSKKADSARKKAAKRQLDEAKRDLDRIKKVEERAKDTLRESKERTARLTDQTFDIKRDLKRGSIVDSFTSGSGPSVVDQMFEQSKNKDLSKTQRSRLRSTAYGMETQLIQLEKRSEKLTTQLDKATEARDRLLDAKNSAASSLRSEWSLESVMQWDTLKNGPLTAGDIKTQARAKVSQYKTFAKKIDDLRKKGYSAAVIQDVIELGVNEGTYAAEALLGGSKSDMQDINKAYKDMDTYTSKTGTHLTEAMSKGGINAAESLVSGLESQSKKVDDAFYKLGKQAEAAFKRALGIKSPSRVFKGAAKDTIDGGIVGLDENKNRLFGAYEDLGQGVAEAYKPNQLRTALMPSAPGHNTMGQATPGNVQNNYFYYPKADHMSKGVERANQLAQL
ncbi:TP901 family phage tail tape measure protein [Arthrobacter sp. AG1021]|uniref:phage tail tape measure protein n=1 Tax=Arthrobacter sp. AG1021 TaxID=2183908 RepID=UPI000F1681E3|nr:phage tail tape measure protein [Arthrobacter sp. AG1021]RKS19705.1 TP901 family phage tail tape measure protein [Arthrobacter sp. AG1021]